MESRMTIKAATARRELKIGPDLIIIDQVKGNEKLMRVVINNIFVGYLHVLNDQYQRPEGSKIHDLIFAKICQRMQQM